MSDAIKAEIKKLEDRRFQAMIDSDFDTLDNMLGEDLIYTHSTAQSDTRAEYIALCKKGVFKYLKIERPIENIQVYGDTVVVTGQTTMDGAKGWQMVVWQSTPMPAPMRWHQQAGHMTASDRNAARQIISCEAGAIHT